MPAEYGVGKNAQGDVEVERVNGRNMKPLLQHLENESLLLLYMSGEMPAPDRAELELMLKRDGGLRAQLETLRAAELASFEALSQLDASEPLRAVEPVIR